ncbi:MAG: leucyl aminopeptidase [Rhodospirillaceae bacterium]|nr:leucyl aminopeptidase [Rhodospirillaceae bacterium]|tara:strand:- start:5890 stop:7377 length:1488 start_codon:yes stop_codon:yes gene_type:complete
MEFPVRIGAPTSQKTSCAILPIFEGRKIKGVTGEFNTAVKNQLSQLIRSGSSSTKLGQTLLVTQLEGVPADKLLLVGCGKESDFNAKRLSLAISAAAIEISKAGIREATSYLAYGPVQGISEYYASRLTVETAKSVLYRFDEMKSRPLTKSRALRLAIAVNRREKAKEARLGVSHGQAISLGMDIARDLGNRPPNLCTPTHLANESKELARTTKNLKTKILSEQDMKSLGMGALLSVTRGAKEPAKFIVMEYQGGTEKDETIVLCGKGITFDTGGISLKPPPKMDEMKFDMCGAATVIGTMAALGKIQSSLNVIALIPACENMPGSEATRPSDIVKSMSGQTIEIINTDAEGRLILCDALTYASRYNPSLIIDVATLTGACVIAIGHVYTGLFSNNDELSYDLVNAGKRSLDPAWRLPVDDEYGESIESNFADFANSGAREGGASIAAQFLSRFVGKTPWAHLDIAGIAWKTNREKGATGRPVPMLMDFLLNRKN